MARRRVRGEGSIYQTADGRWFFKVQVWEGGRRRARTVSAPDRRALLIKKAELERELAAGILADNPTVDEWMTYWLDEVSQARERTKDGYRGYVKTWISPHLGSRRLDKLRPEHIRAMLRAMEKAGRAEATRRQAYAILRAALKAAVLDRKLTHSPAESVAAPRPGRKHHGRLSLDEAHAVISTLEGDPYAARWLVALLEGLRQGEALGLRWEDVDLPGRLLYVRQTVGVRVGLGVLEGDVKSDTSLRAVPMLEPVAWALERLPHRGGYVFGQVRKGDLTIGGHFPRRPEGDHRAWEALLERAGVQDYPLHSARETTASLLSEAKVPDVIIQEIMGHANVRITRDAYIHGDVRLRREGMAALEALVFPDVT